MVIQEGLFYSAAIREQSRGENDSHYSQFNIKLLY